MAKAAEATEVKPEIVEEGGELVVTCRPSDIEANFDALEDRVRRMVADYEGAAYDMSDDGNVRAAKRDRTYLNGIVKQIDERRKAVKREYLRPLDAFEARCREISGIAKGASDAIKAQLDEAERLRRERAYAALEAHYGEVADLLAPVVPYSRVHEGRWLNKTVGEVKAKQLLEEKVGLLAEDWDTLKGQRGSMGHYEVAERELFRTLDLGAALKAARQADEEDARLEEMKAAMEPERAPEPEPAAPAPEPAPQPVQAVQEPVIAPRPGEPRTPWVVIVPEATRSDMEGLAMLLQMSEVSGRIVAGTLEQVYRKAVQGGR
ncbi:DUF1351 domain-containing protein [Collinsella aerofaciens]|uniref:DUF1351 domain-containing protein n=1 Tax=Collinsella aerofaciens TaxID=74426 RepID=A0A6N9JIP9_9ACTN|nr:DUF1351 domain-containing protein [Collinsella aerofaciens]MZJ39564.1 DUF1351 domain-containing protein [Collinsella aerofaciens]